jgi:tetratricopeptide (TPR) repeat protein/transcriptional regulator with XRE-family HTH domain
MSAADANVPPGAWLRMQRVAAGLTQENLAERSGVSVRTIADLERGRTRRPYPSSVRALTSALGLPTAASIELIARYRASGHALEDESQTGYDRQPGSLRTVPRQLPTAVPYFTGRTRELELLDEMLGNRGCRRDGVVITVIGGTAGVGKTALALHWAHQLASMFPDGQLYANLRGFDPSGQPADPADVIRGFVGALQVHPERIPADLEGLAALFRSLLADRRMLVFLDNASDVAQVRPLLPASPECLVIVTSRRELAALAACEGARLLSLDVLTEAEANELLAVRLGTQRAEAEPGSVKELAHLCARLPLALSIAVARAAAQPALSLAALAAELTEIQGRLDALDIGDPAANVRTVFSLSYRYLSDAAARMFRLLGLHPGPDITDPAAASLAGVPLRQARADLRDLARASLIIESVPGRYGFHDLLRAYAAEQASPHENDASQREASHRMLDHYLHTAHRAHLVLYPGREVIVLPEPRRQVRPEVFVSKGHALSWLEAEYQVLLKTVDLAVRAGFDDQAWQLPVVLCTFYLVCGHWHDGAATQRTALTAARKRGNLSGQARALRELGGTYVQTGEHAQAQACLSQAWDLCRLLGDDVGLARTATIRGQSFEFQGRYRESLDVNLKALKLSETAPDDPDMQLVRASALNNAAWCHVQFGEYAQARARCQQALDLCREIGYSPGEAGTWDTLGVVWQGLGEHAEAVACYLQATALDREMGNRLDLAQTLSHLGDTHHATGDLSAARDAWAEALAVLEELHHIPAALEVRAKLRDLGAVTS